MKILVYCNTYYQLISAIQLKLSILKEANVDLLLSDVSLNAITVAENLRRLNLFASVEVVTHYTGDIDRGLKAKYERFLHAISDNTNIKNCYDELIFYNLDSFFYGIIVSQKHMNSNLTVAAFDEGILSIGRIDYRLSARIANRVRTVLRQSNYAGLQRYYCYFPPLCRANLIDCELVRIPSWMQTKSKLESILSKVFVMQPQPIPQKYIYFCSSSDIDGFSFGETELVLRIANMVGPENLLVKMHPRDRRRVFQDHGISVMDNSYVPWEAMQICGVATGKTLVTAISGSFLTSTTMLADGTRGVFLLPPREKVPPRIWELEERIREVVRKLISEGGYESISVIEGFDFGALA